MRQFYLPAIMILLITALSCSDDKHLTQSTSIYQLSASASPAEAGSVSPSDGEFDENEDVEVSASANEGWVFESWQGDYNGTNNPATIRMDGDKEVTALFETRDYTLNIDVVGEGEVHERLLKQTATDYEAGSMVELTADPADGWRFSHWEGDLNGSENPAEVEMDQEKNVTAVFVSREYELNITIEGEGRVNEQLLDEEESVVELTAVPAQGWRFSHWEGDLEGDDNPAVIEVDEEKNVTAVFERRDYELTIEVEGEGSVSEEVVQAKTDYPYETMVELTANPASGWVFDRWEGDLSGSENPEQIEIDGEKEVTAVFVRDIVSLDILTEGNGDVSSELISGVQTSEGFETGSEVELLAEADDGWMFSHWEGDLDGSDNPARVEMDSDKEVTAVFERREYELIINIEGQGSVSEEVVQSKTDYPYETVVELTASPASGWEFVRWEGDLTGSSNPATIEVDEEKEVTAVFEEQPPELFPLSIDREGDGSVSADLVSGNSSGGQYEEGSVVELTATPDDGWEFSHWEGDLSGSSNPATIEIDEAKSVTAVFEELPPDTYSLTVASDGGGSVSEDLVSGNSSGGQYAEGSVVELTATPDDGWEFSHWEGDLSGSSNPATLEMDESKSVTAVFEELPPETFSLSVTSQGNGSVSENLVSGNSSGGQYEEGSVVELTAEPADGWVFSHWEDDLSGSSNPQQIEMDEEKQVTAVFEEEEPDEFSLSVITDGEGMVSEELISGNETGGGYEDGSVVELTAEPGSGWEFSHWEDDLSGDSNPEQIEMDEEKQVTAIFEEITYSLDLSTQGPGSITVELISGEETGGGYTAGSVVRITVEPANNREFEEWTGDLSGDDNPIEVTMNQDIEATAILSND